MGVDYGTLSTLKTPDLMYRDSRLMGRTRVMGVSQTAAFIHVVAFVCTAGGSLPFNLAFGIWHAHRYRKVKEERMWIRQILATRNVAYQGRGHWVDANPNPNAGHNWNATPTGAHGMYNAPPGGHGVYNPPPGGQWVYNNPSAGHFVQGTPSVGHWVHVPPSAGHWMQPTPGIGQTVHATPTPHADNDFQMQFAQTLANDLQQDFGNNNNNNNNNNQANTAYDQSFNF